MLLRLQHNTETSILARKPVVSRRMRAAWLLTVLGKLLFESNLSMSKITWLEK